MRFLVIQSIPLGRDTRTALREAGGHVIPHNSQFLAREISALAAEQWRFVLNMGNSWVELEDIVEVPLINPQHTIQMTRTPGKLREFIGDLLPDWPKNRDQYPLECWIKAPGHAGRGKYKKAVPYPLVLPPEWDCQVHVPGEEYRIITVGHRAVQGFRRTGNNSARSYTWVGVRAAPDPVLDIAREAAKRFDTHNVLRAWDTVLQGDKAYILEGNSSPGVNSATALRIADEIERQLEEGRIV